MCKNRSLSPIRGAGWPGRGSAHCTGDVRAQRLHGAGRIDVCSALGTRLDLIDSAKPVRKTRHVKNSARA